MAKIVPGLSGLWSKSLAMRSGNKACERVCGSNPKSEALCPMLRFKHAKETLNNQMDNTTPLINVRCLFLPPHCLCSGQLNGMTVVGGVEAE